MNMINLKTLVSILPMDEKIRQDTIGQIPQLTPDQQLDMLELCWAAFFELFDSRVDSLFKQTLAEAANGKHRLHNKLYQEIEQEVQEEFTKKFHALQDQSSIETIRKELKTLVTARASKQANIPLSTNSNNPVWYGSAGPTNRNRDE